MSLLLDAAFELMTRLLFRTLGDLALVLGDLPLILPADDFVRSPRGDFDTELSLSLRPLDLSKELERMTLSLVLPEELERFLVPLKDLERLMLLPVSDAGRSIVISVDTAFGLRILVDRLPLGWSEDPERLSLLSPTSDEPLDSTKVLLPLVLMLSCSLFAFAFEFGFIVSDCRRVLPFLRSADRGRGVVLVLF
jgi:hypothetical protein